MRVEDNSPAPSDLRSTGVGRASDTRVEGRPGERRAETATDSASLSALSLELSRALHRDAPQETARIERLQQAIDNDTYDVPSSAVSGRIVDAALQSEF